MKKIIALLFLAISINAFATGDYKIQTKESKLIWEGKKVTGEHSGTVAIKSGKLVFAGPEFKGGEFVIDMTTIVNTDVKDPEWKGKLEAHLKNEDFFNTEKFKTATLKIKDVQFGKGGKHNVTADLTIKGITKPVLFDAVVENKGDSVTANAVITINRIHWNVKYKSGSFFKDLGDKLIYDDVKFKVSLKAKK